MRTLQHSLDSHPQVPKLVHNIIVFYALLVAMLQLNCSTPFFFAKCSWTIFILYDLLCIIGASIFSPIYDLQICARGL